MNPTSKSLLVRAVAPTGGPLVRPALLAAAKNALRSAAAVEAVASHRPVGLCVERLSAHREILARRAANVALASETTANELSDLRDAIRRLVAVRGWAARKLGLVHGMN